MQLREGLKRRAQVINAGKILVDDETASIAPELFGRMKYEDRQPDQEITLIKNGTRINWNGTLKRAVVDLWDTEENNPDNAPTLWEDIMYKDGNRIIPGVITVGTAFVKDECGWWNNTLYKSLIDANVYTPEQYAAGWEVVE